MRVAAVAVLVGLLAGPAHAQLAGGLSDPIGDPGSWAGPVAVGVGPQLTAGEIEGLREHAADELVARTSSPEAVADRARSQAAFAGQSAAEARETAAESFGLDEPAWLAPTLRLGERIVAYLGDDEMLVERRDGRRGVVESGLPLWATAGDGTNQRVSVELEDHGETYAPENAIVDSTIAKQIDEGVVLDDAGVVVRPEGLRADAAPAVMGGKVFFANAARDTDWLVAPLPVGIEASWQLRSPEAPTELRLRFDLRPGSTLQGDPDAPGGLAVIAGGAKIASVAPVVAADAQGRSVPARYRLDGDGVTVLVDHAGGDYAYPILVDPVVVGGDPSNVPTSNGWYQYPWPSGMAMGYDSTNGLKSWITSPGAVGANTAAVWGYHVRPGAYIYGLWHHASAWLANGTCMMSGLSADGGNWMSGWNNRTGTLGPASVCSAGSGVYSFTECATTTAVCDASVQTGKYAYLQLYSYVSGAPGTSTIYADSTTVSLGDDIRPTLALPSVPVGWTKQNAMSNVVYGIYDTGLGVLNTQVDYDGSTTIGSKTLSCSGRAATLCPTSETGTFTKTAADGQHTLKFTVHDAVNNANDPNGATVNWWVDTTGPAGNLTAPAATIKGTVAFSGTMTDPSSGPGSWALEIKPTASSTWQPACSSTSPSSGSTYSCSLNTTTLSDGTYDLRAKMTDLVPSANGGPNVSYTGTATTRIQNVAPTNTAPPTISGSAADGQTLTATAGTWTAAPFSAQTYQWRRCDTAGANCTDVTGATNPAYAVVSADIGKTLRVVVTTTNLAGSATATSAPTATVVAVVPSNTVAPTVSGTARDQQTLTASPGTWTGSPILSTSYQWRRCDTTGANCTDISGATTSTYGVTSADIGATLRVAVTASNSAGAGAASSTPTPVIEAVAPSNTAAPQISGTPRDQQTLTASQGTWSGSPSTSTALQWQRCDSVGANCIDAAGATGSSYAAVPGDVGHKLRIVVTECNSAGCSTGTSAPVGPIVPEPPSSTTPPAISGDSTRGQTLTADPGTWTGTPTITYAYQWRRSGDAIPGATQPTYVVSSDEVAKQITVTVTATNGGGPASTTSAAVTGIGAPVNDTRPSTTGSATADHSLTADPGTWRAQPAITSVTYQWLRDGEPIADAIGSTYALTADDTAHDISLRATVDSPLGTASSTSAVSTVRGAPVNEAYPTIAGSPVVGRTLDSTDGTWRGYPAPSSTYAWSRCDAGGGDCSEISGATSSEYTPTAGDAGHTLRLNVVKTNGEGTAEATSDATEPVAQFVVFDVITGELRNVDQTFGRFDVNFASERSQRHELLVAAHDADPDRVGEPVSLDLLIDGQVVPTIRDDEANGVSRLILDSADLNLSDGLHTMRVRGTDGLGRTTPSEAWNFSYDATAPSLDVSGSLPTAAGSTVVDAGTLAVVADAHEPLGAPDDDIEILLDGEVRASTVGQCEGLPCDGHLTWQLDPTQIEDGAHTVIVKATDAARNSTTRTIEFSTRAGVDVCGSPAAVAPTDPAGSAVATATDAVSRVFPEVGAAVPAGNPVLSAHHDDFVARQTDVTAVVASDPQQGLAVQTSAGRLCVSPAVDAAAPSGVLVGEGAAAVFPDTREDADTIIEAKTLGLETWTTIRSADAPHQFVWNVDLPGAQELRTTPDGGVQIVELSPPVIEADADPDLLDDAEAAVRAEADRLKAEITANDPADDTLPAEFDAAFEDDLANGRVDLPSQEDAPALDADALATGVLPFDGAAQDAVLGAADADRAAMLAAIDASAEDSITRLRDEAETVQRAVEDEGRVVATILPPVARDADGSTVPSRLEVIDRDSLKLIVDHDGAAYPVVADPDVKVTVGSWEPETYDCSTTTYVPTTVVTMDRTPIGWQPAWGPLWDSLPKAHYQDWWWTVYVPGFQMWFRVMKFPSPWISPWYRLKSSIEKVPVTTPKTCSRQVWKEQTVVTPEIADDYVWTADAQTQYSKDPVYDPAYTGPAAAGDPQQSDLAASMFTRNRGSLATLGSIGCALVQEIRQRNSDHARKRAVALVVCGSRKAWVQSFTWHWRDANGKVLRTNTTKGGVTKWRNTTQIAGAHDDFTPGASAADIQVCVTAVEATQASGLARGCVHSERGHRQLSRWYGGSNREIDTYDEAANASAALGAASNSELTWWWSELSTDEKNVLLANFDDPAWARWAPRIDTKGPSGPVDFTIGNVNSTARTASIIWSSGEDRDVAPGVGGSGVDSDRTEYRVRRSTQSWGPWLTTAGDGADLASVPVGAVVQLQVVEYDLAGNASPTRWYYGTIPAPSAHTAFAAAAIVCVEVCPGAATAAWGATTAAVGSVFAGALSIVGVSYDVAVRDAVEITWSTEPAESFEDAEFRARGRAERRRFRKDGRDEHDTGDSTGRGVGPGQEAHHIVAAGAKAARYAREVLWRCGIDPNDFFANGVGLNPKFHRRVHTKAYYEAVNRILKRYDPTHGFGCGVDDGELGILGALHKIARLLKSNKFPG